MNIHDILNSIPAQSAQQASKALKALLQPTGPLYELYADSLTIKGDTGLNVGIGYYTVNVDINNENGQPDVAMNVSVHIETQSGHVVSVHGNVLPDGTLPDDPYYTKVIIGSDDSNFFYPMVIENLQEIGVKVHVETDGDG